MSTLDSTTIGHHPKILGDFELRHEIGRGGMGTVYEAWQRSLQRTIALKVLASHVHASESAIQRFIREARAAAKLHHSHIIPIFAQGEDKGVYFYAMELVDGVSLNSLIQSARKRHLVDTATFNPAETVTIDRRAPSGGSLEHKSNETRDSHDRLQLAQSTVDDTGGVGNGTDSVVEVHDPWGICLAWERCAEIARHIANVADALDYAHQHGVIHRDIKPHNLMLGRDGRLRIADFGLVRLAEQPAVTMTGEMLGSPLYMAPEQINKGPSEVGVQADVYSLGVTLYEWLALIPPFPGETREAILSQILSGEPRPVRSKNAEIPVELETICSKAIERDSRRRYQTAGEFRDDLQRFISRRPILAKRSGVFVRSGKFLRRHQVPVLVGLAAVFALALTLSIISQNSSARSKDAQLQEALTQVADRRQEVEKANQRVERLIDAMRIVWPAESDVLASGADIASPLLASLVQSGRQLRGVDGKTVSAVAESLTLRTPLALAQRTMSEFYDATAPTDWPPAPADSTDFVPVMLQRAVDMRYLNPASAEEIVRSFVEFHPDDYYARQLLACLCVRLEHYESLLEHAKVLVTLQSADPHAYLWRAVALLFNREIEQALVDFERAERLDNTSTWGRVLRGLALIQLNRTAEAIVIFDKARAQSPGFTLALLGQSAAHARLGSWMSAVEQVTKALQIDPGDVQALTMRGDYHLMLNQYEEAADDFTRAMKISGGNPGLLFRLQFARNQISVPTDQTNRLPTPAEKQEPVMPTAGETSDTWIFGRFPRSKSIRSATAKTQQVRQVDSLRLPC